MPAKELANEIGGASAELLAKSAGLPQSVLRERPDQNEWSIIEVLAHHVDVDHHYLSEALAIRTNPEHTFIIFDDEAWKAHHTGEGEIPIKDLMNDLEKSHRAVLGAVAKLTPEELERTGIHPRRDAYTVREVLLRLPAHDRNHAEQIESIREHLGRQRSDRSV